MLRTIGTGLVVVVLFAVVNGGYVYRTRCPLPGGATQTSWTYAIDDFLPYIRSTSPPCHAHTGTRLVLASLGVGGAVDDSGAAPPVVNSRDLAAAKSIGAANLAIAAEWSDERRRLEPLARKIRAGTVTAADTALLRTEVTRAVARDQTIRNRLDSSPAASDPQLIEAKRLLSTWLGYQIAANDLVLTAHSKEEFVAGTKKLKAAIARTGDRFRPLVVELQIKYPQVHGWQALAAAQQP